MKAKLYKGPRHGKSVILNPQELEKGYVDFAVMNPKSKGWINDHASGKGFIYTAVMPGYSVARYEVRIMSGTIAGRSFSAPAMHPDGSIILQYKE